MKKLIFACAALATSSQAHVVMAPAEAAAGSYYAGEFRIGHGCEDAATTAVRIEVPEGILIARPRPKPGWAIEVERAPLAVPVMTEGREQRDRITAIIWRGNLPPDQFDGFGLMIKLPKGKSGPLYLPVRQYCGSEAINWTEIPVGTQNWGALKRPAPVIAVAPASEHHGH